MRIQVKSIGKLTVNKLTHTLKRLNRRVQKFLDAGATSSGQVFQPVQPRIKPCFSLINADSPILIWVADTAAQCVYFNQTWLNFTGRSLQQELGNGWTEGVHPEDAQRCMTTFLTAFHAREPFSIEYRLRHASGEYRWVLDQGMPQFLDSQLPDSQFSANQPANQPANQQFIGYVGSCVDITHLKQAEAQASAHLAEAIQRQQQLDAIAANLPGGVFRIIRCVNGEFKGVFASAGYRELCALDPDLIIADPDAFIHIIHPEDRQYYLQQQEDAIQNGNSAFEAIARCILPTGETKWIATKAQLYRQENGDVIIDGIDMDITDRKQIELETIRDRDLREAVYNSSTDALFLVDAATLLTIDCNDRAVELFEANSKAALINIEGHTLQHRQFTAAELEQITDEINTKGFWSREIEYVTRRGNLFWGSIAAKQITVAGKHLNLVRVTDIGNRKRAELALQQLNAQLEQRVQQRTQAQQQQTIMLQTILNSMGDGVLVMDAAGEFLLYNPALETIAPLSASSSIEAAPPPAEWQDYWDVLLPDQTPCPFDEMPMMRALRGEKVNQAEILLRHKLSLDQVCVEITACPFYDGAGSLAGAVGLFRDISDRKRAEAERQKTEQALRKSEALLAEAQDVAELGSWEYDLRTKEITWTKAVFQIFDLDPRQPEPTFEELGRLYHPEDFARLQQCINNALATGESYQLTLRIPMPDGSLRYLEGTGQVEYNAQGEIIRLFGTAQNMTTRKAAELALQESEERFRQLAENVGAVFWLTDLQYKLLYVSPAFRQIWGRSPDYLFEPGVNLLDTLHPDDRGWMRERMKSKPHGNQYDVEYRILRPDGEVRWIRDRSFPIQNNAGEVYRLGGIAEDITVAKHLEAGRRQLEQELRQINAELERRVERRTRDLQSAMEAAEAASLAKSTFLANMSHELRTPLNAILGFAQLMHRDSSLKSEQRQQLNIINRSGKHLLNLINDILEMSKIEAGGISFNPAAVDLYALLDTLAEMFYLRATEKGLRLILDRSDAVPQYIETDENKLRQVLINLLGNAIKFTPSGSVTLLVQPSSTPIHPAPVHPTPESDRPASCPPASCSPAPCLSFSVQDTGIGIDPDELDRLFEPFVQSQQRQSQEGTGLGLPISRRFVQLMGGELTVSTTAGTGSTFTFTVPLRLADASTLPTPTLHRTVLGLSDPQVSHRVLVVEDHAANRQLLVQLLRSVGFEVQAAANGEAAIALWQTSRPHLIWMDMRMPVMDGYEATRRIRAMEAEEQGSGGTEEQRRNAGGKTADHPLSSPAPHPSPRCPMPDALPPMPDARRSSPPPSTIIIALTASAFEEERARVLEVGCDDFVRKPFQETELLETMANYLGVQYHYAAAESDDRSPAPLTAPFDPIAALKTLSPVQLAQLYQATVQLDSAQLRRLIEQFAPKLPLLAELLIEKLEDFDLQQILDLLQAAID